MKKAGIQSAAAVVALVMALVCCAFAFVFSQSTAARADEATWAPDTTVWDGEVTPGPFEATTGFYDAFSQIAGGRQYTIRIDDGSDNRGPIETFPLKGWGARVAHTQQFDFNSLEMEIDFAYATGTPNAPQSWGTSSLETLYLLFSSYNLGTYPSATSDGLYLVVGRNVDDASTADVDESTQYGFTIGVGADANGTTNTTFMGDGATASAIPFQGGYSGWVFTYETSALSFKFGEEGSNYTLTISEVANPSNSHVIVMPKASCAAALNVDTDAKVYFSYGALVGGSGVYRFNKITCDDTEAYDASISDMVNTIKSYIAATQQDLAVSENIAEAIALRNQVSLDVFRSYDVAYWQPQIETANTTLNAALSIDNLEDIVNDGISAVETALDTAANNDALASIYAKLEEIDSFVALAIERDTERGVALQDDVSDLKVSVEAKAYEIIGNYVTQFETAVESISSMDDMIAASTARDSVNTYFAQLSAEHQSALRTRLDAADAAFAEVNSADGWLGSDKSLVYVDGTSIVYGSKYNGGMSSDVRTRDNSTITYTAAMDANNFTMTFTIDKIVPNGWISIGLMAKTNSFSSSSDTDEVDGIPKVQNNPGLMFLLSPSENGTVTAQFFFIRLTTTDFYAALITEFTFDFELGEEITLSIKAADTDRESYLNISLGGYNLPRRIDNAALISVFGSDYDCYLNICQLWGGSEYTGYEMTIETINGHEATSADVANADPLPEPSEGDGGSGDTDGETKKSGCGGTVAASAALVALAAIGAAFVAVLCKKRTNL